MVINVNKILAGTPPPDLYASCLQGNFRLILYPFCQTDILWVLLRMVYHVILPWCPWHRCVLPVGQAVCMPDFL